MIILIVFSSGCASAPPHKSEEISATSRTLLDAGKKLGINFPSTILESATCDGDSFRFLNDATTGFRAICYETGSFVTTIFLGAEGDTDV